MGAQVADVPTAASLLQAQELVQKLVKRRDVRAVDKFIELALVLDQAMVSSVASNCVDIDLRSWLRHSQF